MSGQVPVQGVRGPRRDSSLQKSRSQGPTNRYSAPTPLPARDTCSGHPAPPRGRAGAGRHPSVPPAPCSHFLHAGSRQAVQRGWDAYPGEEPGRESQQAVLALALGVSQTWGSSLQSPAPTLGAGKLEVGDSARLRSNVTPSPLLPPLRSANSWGARHWGLGLLARAPRGTHYNLAPPQQWGRPGAGKLGFLRSPRVSWTGARQLDTNETERMSPGTPKPAYPHLRLRRPTLGKWGAWSDLTTG